jgi:hypothetical protein
VTHSLKKFVYIFDLDGVLIEPFGYRAAFEATLQYFLEPGDLTNWISAKQAHPVFESLGVTNEWDMVAIALAELIDHLFSIRSPDTLLTTLAEFMDWSKSNRAAYDGFDLTDKLHALETVFHREGLPSQVLLQAGQAGEGGYFSELRKHPLFSYLLADTWNIRTCITTAVFQNYSLGSEDFRKTYGFTGPIQSESYLDLYDHVNISMEYVKQLIGYRDSGRVSLGILTLRSSLPPEGITAVGSMYSPEAEKARSLIGFSGVPLMAFGRIYYLSQIAGLPIPQLIKPSMPQALGAILAGLSADEAWAITTLGELCQHQAINGQNLERIKVLVGDGCSVFVFEDSRVGIQACKSACQWLEKISQKEIELHAWGVSTHPVKVETLIQHGAAIFADVNAALVDSFRYLPKGS